ncbi:YhfC family intramembrane metalloprotease [Candidatus Bathyarchaeota archaeon]|nr:YhfC family intramembrane metalloprotease [Candidatus Bathyarchaeota archaeon]
MHGFKEARANKELASHSHPYLGLLCIVQGMNPWLILGPAGMIAVGVTSVLYWRRRTGAPLRLFYQGGLWWGLAMAPKFLMDIYLTPRISYWVFNRFGLVGALIGIGLYVGLRTGLLESAIVLLAFNREELNELSVDEAVAFGIGFGAFEAMFLGIPSLIQIAAFNLYPSMVESLTLDQLMQLLVQLNAPTWVVGAPILERGFTMMAHVYAILLIYRGVTNEDSRSVLMAIAYKSALDAMVPLMQWLLSSGGFGMVYVVEVWVVIMGLVGLWGSRRIMLEMSNRDLPGLSDEQNLSVY